MVGQPTKAALLREPRRPPSVVFACCLAVVAAATAVNLALMPSPWAKRPRPVASPQTRPLFEERKDAAGDDGGDGDAKDDGDDRDDVFEDDDVFERRRRRIERVCARHKKRFRYPPSEVLDKKSVLVSPLHRFGTCMHAKVATTTLSHHFVKLLPPDLVMLTSSAHTEVRHAFTFRKVGLRATVANVSEYVDREKVYFFSFVRHPLDRLVSAYANFVGPADRHKGAGGPPHRLRAIWAYRNFSLFVDNTLDQFGRGSCFLKNRVCQQVDVHVRPYYGSCAYCDLRYAAIGKMENFDRDMARIASVAGLTKTLAPEVNRAYRATPKNASRTAEYMSLLDEGRRRRLLEMYRLDFELFGYDADEYLL